MLAAFHIVSSPEGERRREELMAAVTQLRSRLSEGGLQVLGAPSPIVPVLIGRDDVARTAARLAGDAGVLTNLVEYPAVSRNSARFRLQVMSSHEPAACESAAKCLVECIMHAEQACASRGTAAE